MSDARWEYQPTGPGLWARRQWWGDDGGPYDRDALFELVDRGNGYLEVASAVPGKFYALDLGGGSVSMWFGPIPKCPVERLTKAEWRGKTTK